jgi:hypothetical protein
VNQVVRIGQQPVGDPEGIVEISQLDEMQCRGGDALSMRLKLPVSSSSSGYWKLGTDR